MPHARRSSPDLAVKRDSGAPVTDSELGRRASRAVIRRLVPLIVAAVVLYGVAPAVLEVLGAYRRLGDVDPAWWIVVVGTQAAATWCMCSLQRLALNRAPWFPVATSQLAGAAFSKVVPGGSAAAAALQARMLLQAGLSPTAIGTGLTAGALLLLAALAGLPLLALPALLLGKHIPNGLLETAAVGLGVFVILFALGTMPLLNDDVLRALAGSRRLKAGSAVGRRRATSYPSVCLTSAICCGDHSAGRGHRRWPRRRAGGSSISCVCMRRYSQSTSVRRYMWRCWPTAPRSFSGISRSRPEVSAWWRPG